MDSIKTSVRIPKATWDYLQEHNLNVSKVVSRMVTHLKAMEEDPDDRKDFEEELQTLSEGARAKRTLSQPTRKGPPKRL